MPPRKQIIDRNYDDMVDPNALHITPEQAEVFGAPRETLRKAEVDALRAKAARADELEEQLSQALAEQGQSNALMVQDGALMVQGFQFSPTGLIAPEGYDEEVWKEIGKLLFKLEGSIQWLIGDWVVYGEGHYGDIKKIAKFLDRKPETLYNYASVCRAIETSRRREVLSFGHHYEVMSLEPDQQDAALLYAVEHKLSVAAFRKLLRPESDLPALPSGSSFKSLGQEIDKLMQRNPATAKDQDREKARRAYEEMQAALRAFGRQWGIE